MSLYDSHYHITDVYFRITWFDAKAMPGGGGKTDAGVERVCAVMCFECLIGSDSVKLRQSA